MNDNQLFEQYITKLIKFGITISYTEFCIIEEMWMSGFLKALNGLPKAKHIHFKEPIKWKSYNDGYEIGQSVLNQTKNED